jgi:hypothetical protein
MKYLPLLFLLSACAGFGNPNMSAEQIKAQASAKDSNIACVKATGPWGAATTTFVNVDKGVVANGQVTVTNECAVTFSNGITPKQ